MKVKILRTTVADGRFVRAGEVYDLSDRDARTLIMLGKAVAVGDEPQEQTEQLTTESADAVVDTETPKRKGRRRAV